MSQTRRLKKPAEVLAEFHRRGITVADWAREHQVSRFIAYQVLRNPERHPCKRGQSHRIAVLLGLKHGELGSTPADLNAVAAPRALRQATSRGVRP